MRSASPQLVTYLNQVRAAADVQLAMADCYAFALGDGTILAYTNIDKPVTLDGTLYLASALRVDGLKYKSTRGLDVDQQTITIAATSADLIEGVPALVAIQNGILDGAEITRSRAFLNSFADEDCLNPIGGIILFKGRVGEIKSVGRTEAQVTVNSDLTLLDINMPRNLYSPACVHVLYDQGCGLSEAAFSTSGIVGAGSNLSTIVWAGADPKYAQGKILFTSGVNAGIAATVKSAVAGVSLILVYPLLEAPAAGDAFTIAQGCDHTMATCTAKFNNLANFRGFPFIPPPTYAL